eukprot:2857994-Prymnesium_polylepis.1
MRWCAGAGAHFSAQLHTTLPVSRMLYGVHTYCRTRATRTAHEDYLFDLSSSRTSCQRHRRAA